jgi:hypothetical protein
VVESALLDALRDLILPGLAAFELSNAALDRWVASGAPTAITPVSSLEGERD